MITVRVGLAYYWAEFSVIGLDRAAQDGCAPARLAGPLVLASWADQAARGRRPGLGFGPN
jgi:hypothetical protein